MPLCGSLNACLSVSVSRCASVCLRIRAFVAGCLCNHVFLCVGVCVRFCVSSVCWWAVCACVHAHLSLRMWVCEPGLVVRESECVSPCFWGCLLWVRGLCFVSETVRGCLSLCVCGGGCDCLCPLYLWENAVGLSVLAPKPCPNLAP